MRDLRTRMRTPACAILAVLTLSGCLDWNRMDENRALACAQEEAHAQVDMFATSGFLDRDPGVTRQGGPAHPLEWLVPDPRQDWDDLYVTRGANKTPVTSVAPPPGWTGEATALGDDANASLYRVRLRPVDPSPEETKWYAHQVRPPTLPYCPAAESDYPLFLQPPVEGDVLTAGQGALVYTAGFWENGTLFYTNMPKVHESGWPRASPYEWEGSDPLPVYVYDSARTERPPQWAPCAPRPPTNGECAWSYFTTIEGFNEALKGLSTNAARVVHIPPEKAYTTPSNDETHPLYGDALIFYIRVFEVHEVPCTQDGMFAPRPPCEAGPLGPLTEP